MEKSPEAKKKKRVVNAVGGNSLGKNLEEQRRDVKVSAKAIAELLEEDCEVLVVHGNGPQVGLINNAFNEYYNNHKNDGGFPVPLAMAGAMSEAYIGYDLQNALQEEFANRNLKVNGVATLITQTEVDENDPAFNLYKIFLRGNLGGEYNFFSCSFPLGISFFDPLERLRILLNQ